MDSRYNQYLNKLQFRQSAAGKPHQPTSCHHSIPDLIIHVSFNSAAWTFNKMQMK